MEPLRIGPRVSIYGNSGSGKTTLGRELGQILGVPWVELDAVFHANPNWVDLSRDEFRARVTEFLDANPDGWVLDGNYSAAREIMLPLADTVVWLHLPFRVVYPRLARRTVVRSFQHAELWNGNRETLRQTFLSRDSMLLWGIRSWRTSIANTRTDLATIPHRASVHELRSTGAVREFVAAARAGAREAANARGG